MPTITLTSVAPLVKDYCRNQNLTDARVIRALDQSADIVNSELGLPCQEKAYTFDFDQDQLTYALPTDYSEPIFLRYSDNTYNKNSRFAYRPPEYIFERTKDVTANTRLFGVGSSSGDWLLYVAALNTTAPLTLDTFDYNNAVNWIASGDALNIADDVYVYKEGSGSLKFDITVTGTRATLTKTIASQDLNVYLDIGHFKCWVYLANITNFTSLSFSWMQDTGNYWKDTVTTQADGTAFAVGWNAIDFLWLGSTEVGSPSPHTITIYKIDLDYTGAYTGGTNFRIDYLRLVKTDSMILNYYSLYKGTDAAGTTYLENFTALTDIFSFGTFDTGLRNLYAIYAAVLINPQILVDDKQVQEQYKHWTTIYKKKYPRKRINNLLAIPETPKTD